MATETLVIPKKEVLRFIVESAIDIQGREGSSDTPLVDRARKKCHEWNCQIANKLVEKFPDAGVAFIFDGNARGSQDNNRGHVIGISIYRGELFAYDASIAQQGGNHARRPVRIWQGSFESLRIQLVETFGGSWKDLDTAVDFLTGKLTFPYPMKIPHFI